MPALPNPKHERFAQELAKGKTADEAYQLAGYKANRHNAAALARQQHISTRVAEIQERVAIRTEITAAAIAERLMRIADVAEKTGVTANEETGDPLESSSKHLAVARAALMDVAKLNGLIVEKNEHSGPNGGPIQANTTLDLSGLTNDQLRALASIKLSADV